MIKSSARLGAKDLISLVLILLSIAVLAGAYAYSHRPPPPTPPVRSLEVADEVRVGIDELFSPANFSFEVGAPGPGSAEVLAVFLLRPKVCPPCLGEVQDYVTVIDQINMEGGEVMPMALVFTEEPTEALHFIRTSALPIPAGYGYPTELAARLGHRDGTTVLQQLVLIDAVEETLFYRIMLPNTVTPAQDKKRLLNQILADRRQDQPITNSDVLNGIT